VAQELPTEEELRALPRRAIVAYAARCARRVQPLYRSKHERHVQAVERAIALAERFAKGEPPRVGEASEATLADVRAADAAADAAVPGYATAGAAATYALLPLAARGDYERLRSICPQGFPEVGDSIDPGENGPLGPLWPARRLAGRARVERGWRRGGGRVRPPGKVATIRWHAFTRRSRG